LLCWVLICGESLSFVLIAARHTIVGGVRIPGADLEKR
jgi:hypothetical protein